jgi:arabinose-5-phosphate isomerase
MHRRLKSTSRARAPSRHLRPAGETRQARRSSSGKRLESRARRHRIRWYLRRHDSQFRCGSSTPLARQTLEIEAEAVSALAGRLTPAFTKAVEMILCTGRVVVSGIGKSGHIGRKVAATLASTGTPSFFVHPAEASHGDLGMITRDDVLIAFSNSGETAELLAIIPIVKRIGAGLISITGNAESNLAKLSDAHLDGAVARKPAR